MKRFLLAFSLVTVLSFNHNNSVQAQGVSISLNIGNQPAWGPVGYDYAAYYYLPDIDVYYDVNRSYFYYWDRGAWRSARYLPYSYGQFDLYGMYKVVINQPTPWLHHDYYRREYGRYRGNRSQIIILNSPDRRYDRVRYNRVDWINPNNGGRYPNYHDKYGVYNRPNNNRPKPNDKYGGNGYGNNGRPNNNNRPNSNNNNRPNNNSNRPNINNDRPNINNDRPNNNQSNNRPNNNQSNNRPNNNNDRPSNNSPKPNDKYSGNSRPSNVNGGNNASRSDRKEGSSSRYDQSRSSGQSTKSSSNRSSNDNRRERPSNTERKSNR